MVKVFEIFLRKNCRQSTKKEESHIEKSVQNEIDVLHKLQHPHIVSLEFSFVSEQIAYIGMEYIEGYSLLHYIPKNGLSESVGSVLFSQLCRAVAYCHSQNVSFSFSFFLSFLLNLFLSLSFSHKGNSWRYQPQKHSHSPFRSHTQTHRLWFISHCE